MSQAEAPKFYISGNGLGYSPEADRSVRPLREFSSGIEFEIQKEWLRREAETPLARAAASVEWLREHPEGQLLMPDGVTAVGDPTNPEAISAAMLLDLTSVAAHQVLIRNLNPRDQESSESTWRALLTAQHDFRSRLDDYLYTSNYVPGSRRALHIYRNLISLSNRAPQLALHRRTQEPERAVIGPVNEYKLLKALHSLGHTGAFHADIVRDMNGFDIGIPYVDPRKYLAMVKYLQVKSISSAARLRAEGKDPNGALRIRVPRHNNLDFFSISEVNKNRLANIMDGYVPIDLSISQDSTNSRFDNLAA